jgi:hypothetical protein
MAGDRTEARRARVRTLWAKPDRRIAEILIEEGFGGASKRTAAGKAKQLSSMVRNVWNDRVALRKKWREQKKATIEDVNETRGEYLARLESFSSDALEILEDDKMKGTPRVQALSELRQIEQAKAKACGVDVAAGDVDADDDGTPLRPKILVYDVSNCSAEVKKLYGLDSAG